MWGSVDNRLLIYTTETTNPPLLRIVQTYEGTADIQVEKLQHNQAFYNLVEFFKIPYAYGLHYMITIHVCFLVIKISTCMVLVLKNHMHTVFFLTLPVWNSLHGNHTRMVFSYKKSMRMVLVLKICMFMVFVRIFVFQIRCPYQYYTPTMSVWDPIFNNTRTVSKKSPYDYGVLYYYGDSCMRMVILRIWLLTYICMGSTTSPFSTNPHKNT